MKRILMTLLIAALAASMLALTPAGGESAGGFFATDAPFAPVATPVPEDADAPSPTNTPAVLFFAPTATPTAAPTPEPTAVNYFEPPRDSVGEGEVQAIPFDAAGTGSAFVPAQGDAWRTDYYNFILNQGYAGDALSRMGLDEAEFRDSIAPNTTFALHDMDGDGVPELLISLYAQYESDPMCVFFYRCGAAGVEYLSGIRPGCYMFTCAKDADYPGVAGYHRSEAGYDELIYFGLRGNEMTMELISRVSYDTDNASGVDETQVTYDDTLYQLFGAEPANASNGVYYMVYTWQCSGLDEAGWDEYLSQWYDVGEGLEAEHPEWESDDSASDAGSASEYDGASGYDDASEYGGASDYGGYDSATPSYGYDYGYYAPGGYPYWGGTSGSYVVAVSGDTYVRTGPGLYYPSVGVLYRGASLPYTGNVAYDSRPVAWYSVQYNGMQAWVSSRYTAVY